MELLYVILCFINVVTATYITNSTISTDYIFSVTDSPYYIQTNVTFTKSVLIENGAEIIFPAGHASQIIFYGNVSAGCNDIDTTTNNDRGLMDSKTYTYIHRDDTLTSPTGSITINSQHPGNTILEFCNVKFYGMQIAMKISTPHFASIKLLIDNCEFDNNDHTHYAERFTQIYISDSIISNTTIVNRDGNAVYDNCDINNYDRFCKFRCTKIAIRNSKLSRNTADTTSDTYCIKFGANAWWGAGAEKLAFYNNFISDCGIAISYVASKYIMNNTFSNIHGQVIQLPYSTKKYELFVINNTFINNNLHSIFYLDENILQNITFKGNKFINNIASDNSLLYLEGFVYKFHEITHSYLLFEDNTFTSNQAANRLITIHIAITDFTNNIFVNNVAGVASVSTVNDIISDNAAIYFGMDTSPYLPSLIFRSNTFKDNKWNAYFIYTKQDVFQNIIIQYNLFNDTHIGPTAKLLSVGKYAYTGINVIIQYNTFIPPTSSSISSIIDKISSSITHRRIQYNNFYNAFTSTFFIETSGRIGSTTEINHNYFDGLIEVNAILNKIDPNAIGLQCQIIQPFYKNPIDMDNIANLPSECLLDSTYSSDCSYNGNIVGCITQSPTTNPTQSPTANPTSDTAIPSESPSDHPSQTPTNNPTIDPTINPSIPRTSNPTWQPTEQPTSYPSNNPSSVQSYQPSSEPSSNPSIQPTQGPTLKITVIQTTKIPSRIYTTNEDFEIENTNGGNTMKYLMAVVIVLSINIE